MASTGGFALRDAELRERCRARGLRVTGQRLAVYRALAADPSHPTVDAAYALLQSQMPSLARAPAAPIPD